MNRKLKADSVIKKRGRPSVVKDKGDVVRSNGLLQRQWERIEACRGTMTATAKHREIVDWYFAQMDADGILVTGNAALEDAAQADRDAKEKLNSKSKHKEK